MNSQQLYNLVGEDNIFHVDGLCFCAHGYEFCNTCSTDLRPLNQMHVFPDQEMDAEGWDRELVSLHTVSPVSFSRVTRLQEQRRPLSVIGRLKDSGRRRGDGERVFHCAAHGRMP